jgi:flagellin
MVIYHNIAGQNSLRNLGITEGGLAKSMERLASGLRVNRAADDASGFAISESMRRQVRGMGVAQKNALDGISLLQVADAAFSSTLELLQRMNELALLASNGDKTNAQRVQLDTEFQALRVEINTTGSSTTYNGKAIVSGNGDGTGLQWQIGPETGDLTVGFDIATLTDAALAIDTSLINTQADANTAIAAISGAINIVTAANADLGAQQNRLQLTIGRLGVIAENLGSAESRIRDLDVSSEMTNFTRLQILQQAGTAMLAQANLAPQSVLTLLRG